MAEHGIITAHPGVAVIWAITSNEAGAVVKVLRTTISTGMARDADRRWTITLAQEEDSEEFYEFLDAALPPTAGTAVVGERVYEDGTKVGGGAAGATRYIGGVAGGVENEGAGANRKIALVPLEVDPSSGGYNQASATPSAPTLVLRSYLTNVDLNVPMEAINAIVARDGTTQLYEAVADVEIPANTNGKIAFVPKYVP